MELAKRQCQCGDASSFRSSSRRVVTGVVIVGWGGCEAPFRDAKRREDVQPGHEKKDAVAFWKFWAQLATAEGRSCDSGAPD